MICYLVRHAETLWNEERRFQGKTDQPLGPRGLVQAQRVADRFAAHRWAVVYSSPLRRSVQTAEAIALRSGARIHIETDLAEMDLGAWEGLTGEQIDGQFDGAYRRWCDRPSSVSLPEAEPMVRFRQRARDGFARVLAAASGPDCVVVCHGGVIASLLADWLAADYDHLLRRQSLDNAGVTAVAWQHGRPDVRWINATDHLLPQRHPGAARVL